jgi:8-oxo-dGTP pyrophosphatase MutT (NUDIX family)
MRPPDPYQRLARREIYRNPWLAVEVHDIIHPTGALGEHVLIATGQAAGVLVVDGNDFIFARQARFAAGVEVLEIVKGGIEERESALECARRELREELGLEALVWVELGITYEIPSIVERPVVLFLAREVRAVPSAPEAVERIDAIRIAIDDAYRATCDGRIDDAVTLAALLRYRLLTAG